MDVGGYVGASSPFYREASPTGVGSSMGPALGMAYSTAAPMNTQYAHHQQLHYPQQGHYEQQHQQHLHGGNVYVASPSYSSGTTDPALLYSGTSFMAAPSGGGSNSGYGSGYGFSYVTP